MSTKRNTITGIAFAIGAAIAYGIMSVMVRQGMVGLAPPLVGATIALLSGTIGMAFIGMRNPESNLGQKKKWVGFILLSGVAAGLGVLANYFALSMSPVVIVTPLANTFPIFALLLSYLFLSRNERITLRVVLGTILVVVGATLVTIGRVG